jgi:hypothetical protein
VTTTVAEAIGRGAAAVTNALGLTGGRKRRSR